MNREFFINECIEFYKKYKIPYELRSNSNGDCPHIPIDSDTMLYYNSILNLSINVRFEELRIHIVIEHHNYFYYKLEYNIFDFRCRLYMILEYIDIHKKAKKILDDIQTPKLGIKWKSKNITESINLNFVGEMEDEDEYE